MVHNAPMGVEEEEVVLVAVVVPLPESDVRHSVHDQDRSMAALWVH